MKKIREKLRSESGASILLALLFFLLCAMVGASVLMAAASNAGKSRSSREEQQKYLTLSSALQLVCDELTAAKTKYMANYTVTTIEVAGPPDENNEPTIAYTYKRFEQKKGSFEGGLSTVLPAEGAMEYLFSLLFNKTTGGMASGDDIYVPLSGVSSPTEAKYTLTLTVEAQDDKAGLEKPVTVTVELGLSGVDQYNFHLSASLDEYSMYAELAATNIPSAGNLNKNDGSHTYSMNWTLSQITREEARQ